MTRRGNISGVERAPNSEEPSVAVQWTRSDAAAALLLLLAAGSGVALWRPYFSAPGATLLAATVVAILAVVAATYVPCLSTRSATIALLLVFAAFVAWYIVWQPILGPTSDNAEALEIGVRRLTTGDDPWAEKTRFGGPLSPMLGGFVLATPFVVLAGSVYLQQIVWMGLLLAGLWRWEGVHAALVVGLLFMTSAHTLHLVPNQADNWIVAVAVVLTAWLGWRALQSEQRFAWWATAVLLATALSYRVILWVVVLPLMVFLIRNIGWRRASLWLSVVGVTTLAMSLGPLLIVPDNYMPALVSTVSSKVPGIVPGGAFIVAVTTLAVLSWASARVHTWADVWSASAIGLGTMVATVMLLRLPMGLLPAIVSYETIAYNGTWLIMGLVAMAVRRSRIQDHRVVSLHRPGNRPPHMPRL